MSYNRLIIFVSIAVFVGFSGCIQKRKALPPAAAIKPHTTEIHGLVLDDNYYWLRERGSDDVLKYLNDENKYTEVMTEHTQELKKELYDEMIGRIVEDDSSVPEKYNDYYYYSKNEKGKDYKIYCRKKKSLNNDEEIYLDANKMAEGFDYFDVGLLEVSPNGKMLAYGVDTTGYEVYTIYFKDLRTGNILTDNIPKAYYELVWANDNKTVYYLTLDKAGRPYRLYRHTLGTDYKGDVLLYEETDDKFWASILKSKSQKYLFFFVESSTTTEFRYLRIDRGNRELKLFEARVPQVEYRLYHQGKRFLILTNEEALNFKLMEVPEKTPKKENWTEVLSHKDEIKLDAVDSFDDFLVVYLRRDGFKQIRIIDLKNSKSYYLDFPEDIYTFSKGNNKEYKTNKLRYTYYSPITPKTVIEYNMKEKTKETLKVNKVLNGYDKDDYQVERLYAPADDGEMIPISLVYKKGLKKNSLNRMLLTGYGSYGSSREPFFRNYAISLLDRGFIYAIAHIRGGGELGRQWYQAGKMLNKKNTFTDFINCAEYLVEQKYTSPELLGAAGGSAGGLLMGAITNMRPDLFKVVLAGVPFVDIINTMIDSTIPLTVIEYEEWGNPYVKEEFDYMMSYSPYDNITAQNYPNILITAGLNDSRVQYWEPAKWTAKLRANKTDSNDLLLKTVMAGGHFGSSGRYQFYDKIAFEYAFLIDHLKK